VITLEFRRDYCAMMLKPWQTALLLLAIIGWSVISIRYPYVAIPISAVAFGFGIIFAGLR